MNDEEYLFKQTERERKRNARGAKNKIKGGGGTVRLPSDNLTKKEREAMNGEIVTYKLHSPVKWPEFKRWPPDIQREYLKRLDTSYRPTAEMYADMFGVSENTVSALRVQLGIKTGNRKLPDAAGWQRFTKGEIIQDKEAHDRMNEALAKALMDAASPVKVVRFTYDEFKRKYGTFIFGPSQPKRALDAVADILYTRGYEIRAGIQVRGEQTIGKGFAIAGIVNGGAYKDGLEKRIIEEVNDDEATLLTEQIDEKRVAGMLRALIGTGAKLTIEVTL